MSSTRDRLPKVSDWLCVLEYEWRPVADEDRTVVVAMPLIEPQTTRRGAAVHASAVRLEPGTVRRRIIVIPHELTTEYRWTGYRELELERCAGS